MVSCHIYICDIVPSATLTSVLLGSVLIIGNLQQLVNEFKFKLIRINFNLLNYVYA